MFTTRQRERERKREQRKAAAAQTGKTFDITEAEKEANARFALRLFGKRVVQWLPVLGVTQKFAAQKTVGHHLPLALQR